MELTRSTLLICCITFGLKLKNPNKYLYIAFLTNGNCGFKRLFGDLSKGIYRMLMDNKIMIISPKAIDVILVKVLYSWSFVLHTINQVSILQKIKNIQNIQKCIICGNF